MQKQKRFHPYLFMFLMGLALPLTIVYAFHSHQVSIPDIGEPGKYIRSALGIINTGHFSYLYQHHYLPEIERLPGYPFFIALIYTIFGINNYLAIIFAQCILMGGIVVGVALSVKALLPKLMWPAAILASLTPNLALRAANIMPDILFVFFITAGLCAFLWALKGKNFLLFSMLSMIAFALALYVRPAFLLYPFLTFPLMVYAFKTHCCNGFMKACFRSLLLLGFFMALIAPQIIRIHHYSKQYALSVQGPAHLLFWVYPCLASKWGGKRNTEKLALAEARYAKQLKQLTPLKRNDPGMLYKIQKELGTQLIRGLPTSRIITASFGSSFKMLLYPSFLSIMEDFHQPTVHLSQLKGSAPFFSKLLSIIKASFANPWTISLLLGQIALLALRIIQIIGIIYGLIQPQFRALTLYFLAGSLSFIIISVSIGNPRYRIPLEPLLILFTMLGLFALMQYWKKRKNAL